MATSLTWHHNENQALKNIELENNHETVNEKTRAVIDLLLL
jgi:hypothetical protein